MATNSLTFEEIDGKLILRQNFARPDQFPKELPPNRVVVGETGITLTVDQNGGFHLHVPACLSARLMVRYSLQTTSGPINGNFAIIEID